MLRILQLLPNSLRLCRPIPSVVPTKQQEMEEARGAPLSRCTHLEGLLWSPYTLPTTQHPPCPSLERRERPLWSWKAGPVTTLGAVPLRGSWMCASLSIQTRCGKHHVRRELGGRRGPLLLAMRPQESGDEAQGRRQGEGPLSHWRHRRQHSKGRGCSSRQSSRLTRPDTRPSPGQSWRENQRATA